MGGILEIGSAVISLAQQRAELTAQNVANMATPGYKARRPAAGPVGFAALAGAADPALVPSMNGDVGKTISTGGPSDLALTGEGYFVVRSENQVFYTRNGQFQRDGEGRLMLANRYALQMAGGGDLVVKTSLQVTSDGTVLDGGQAVGKLAVVKAADLRALTPADGGMFTAPEGAVEELPNPAVLQGFIEASNVSTGDEMVALMEALRRAETGQRLINLYDDLMGRAITAFGQGAS
ncbi:MAG TPA: flagellar hook basal-body protein [Caulobacteraceae bacterium]|jgi:flagellar basal-body rod protein FlgG